jgi:hypothetical protein
MVAEPGYPKVLDLKWYLGDKPENIRITVVAGGVPVDLTGQEITAEVRPRRGSSILTVALDIDRSGEADGVIRVIPKASDTEAIHSSEGPGYWDIQWTDSLGDPRTLVTGVIRVGSDVSE